MKKHYDILADVLVSLGLAVPNPDYDETQPYSERLRIVKPDRIASMDETRLTNDTTEKNKSKANRSIVGIKADTRETLVNKGGGDGTAVGGSTMDGRDLPGVLFSPVHQLHAYVQCHLDSCGCHSLTCASPVCCCRFLHFCQEHCRC